MKTKNEIFLYFEKKVKRYLNQDKKLEPTLVFLIIVLIISDVKKIEWSIIYSLGVLLSIIFKYNILYILPAWAFIKMPLWGVLTFIASALSCNTKSKTCLFLYVSLISFMEREQQTVFLSSLFLCVGIYQQLIFPTIKENKEYFTGFFAIATAYLTLTAAELLTIRIPLAFVALIALLSLSSHSLIQQRIQRLREEGTGGLKDPHLTALCLSLLREDLNDPRLAVVQLKRHRRECLRPECFCREEGGGERADLLLRQTFRDVRARFEGSDDPLLCESFVGHLLGDEQTINALHCLSRWWPGSFFSWTALLRSEARLVAALENEDSSNGYEEEYRLALSYDALCLELAKGIHEVLGLKVRFWEEAAREEPRLVVLQRAGLEAVEKMHELNRLYGLDVRRHEESIYSFDATALYVAFLLSATSFKEYAQDLLKRTAKQMQNSDVNLGINTTAEIFVIKTIVREQKASYWQGVEDQAPQVHLKQKSREKKLIIDEVSEGFCNLIKIQKQQLIGNDLNIIIPNCYKQVHNVRLIQLFNFDEIQYKPSQILHKQLILPIKGVNEELFIAEICIKVYVDLEEGICFISTIKQIPKKHDTAIIQFSGNIAEREKGFPISIIKNQDVQKYIEKLQKDWIQNKKVEEQIFSIMVQGVVHEITIGSPLLKHFVSKTNLKQKNVPLHISVKNMNGNATKNMAHLGQKNLKKEVENNDLLMLQDKQSSVASTKKTIVSAVNTLAAFIEKGSVPLYNYILIVFAVVMVLGVMGNLAIYLYPSLNWDNSVEIANPIIEYLSMSDVVEIGMRSESDILHTRNYEAHLSQLNTTQIGQYLNKANYSDQMSQTFKDAEMFLRKVLSIMFGTSSSTLAVEIDSKFETMIPITNTGQSTITNPADHLSKQTLAYREIQMIAVCDYNYLRNHRIFDYLLVPFFNTEVIQYVKKSYINPWKDMIDASIIQSKEKAKKFGIICVVCMTPLFIPLYLIFKKRAGLHERVFDLIASVDSEEISKEVKVLQMTNQIVTNYQEEKQKLKKYIQRYQQNKIIPKSTNNESTMNNTLFIGVNHHENSESSEQSKSEEKDITLKLNNKVTGSRKNKKEAFFDDIKGKILRNRKDELVLQKRKRMGQLDTSDSEYHNWKKICSKHCIFYFFIIIFVLLMIYGVQTKQDATQVPVEGKTTLVNLHNEIFRVFSRMKRITYYLWQGPVVYSFQFGTTDVISSLSTMLNTQIQYQSNHNSMTNILQNCQSANSNQKICQQISTIRTIEGEIAQMVATLIQKKIEDYNNNITNITIPERSLYIQTISTKLKKLHQSIRQSYIDSMFAASRGYQELEFNILKGACIVMAFSILVGLIVLYQMKRKYLKEVYMLTLLNETMIIKNKRIQSYLDTLSKVK